MDNWYQKSLLKHAGVNVTNIKRIVTDRLVSDYSMTEPEAVQAVAKEFDDSLENFKENFHDELREARHNDSLDEFWNENVGEIVDDVHSSWLAYKESMTPEAIARKQKRDALLKQLGPKPRSKDFSDYKEWMEKAREWMRTYNGILDGKITAL